MDRIRKKNALLTWNQPYSFPINQTRLAVAVCVGLQETPADFLMHPAPLLLSWMILTCSPAARSLASAMWIHILKRLQEHFPARLGREARPYPDPVCLESKQQIVEANGSGGFSPSCASVTRRKQLEKQPGGMTATRLTLWDWFLCMEDVDCYHIGEKATIMVVFISYLAKR